MSNGLAYETSQTSDTFWIDTNLFRTGSPRDKEIEIERKRKVINIAGIKFDLEEPSIVLGEAKDIRLNQLFFAAMEFMNQNAPPELVQQALPYINELNRRTNAYLSLNWSPISVSLPEDNTLLIEWDFEHFTIGLSFEHEPEDSGWFIVNDGRVRKTTAWGFINPLPLNDLVDRFLQEIVVYINA